MSIEEKIKMAAKLYEARDGAKAILGEQYAARMLPYQMAIKEIMEGKQCDAIQAAIALCKGLRPLEVLYTIAAAVELVEPSEPT